MPKTQKRRRKVPVTQAASPAHPAPSGSSSNPAATRSLIRRFHVLLKRRAQLQGPIGDTGDAKRALADVEREIEDMGGLGAYQRMSSIGQGKDRGGGSEKVLIEWLQELGVASSAQKEKRVLRLLEVGALRPDNYASCASWIQGNPIDLRSQHPAIAEQDFLLMDEKAHHARWDVISLSLVLNFVPDAKDRGQMLRLAHSMLRPDGFLFLVLPLPCLLNSRYLTPEHFHGLVNAIGLAIVYTRWKEGGKMAYWLLRKSSSNAAERRPDCEAYQKKTVLRQGKRNNFVILL
ncbi:25S rRNA adenine-N(1) methyltransferase [Sparassis crispa]|uniref:25S rRNA adenine-N(1) methyltransferase n=1 Tax=Sparassis crispa TaxID=139825 RepID=A0A401GJV0_9APHY|nr:25S rRNA adenine-N(1) methyltransferase [Sparassis crispa]GBE82446.1 25S rRNA adenine-N(1) methyltransferase [Sparassis crispa]